MLVSALNHALQGLQLNQERFVRHADRISRWGTIDSATAATDATDATDATEGDLVGDMVGLKSARLGYGANLAVVRAADEMLGTLIDALA